MLLFELLLRATGYANPPFFRFDEQVGARHRANTTGWFRNEAEVYLAFNDQGLRVPPDRPDYRIAPRAGDDTIRIAVFGDSYTEGLQVEARERYTHVLETELNRCAARPRDKVEVINFAVSGMGQPREMAMYEATSGVYAPDIVLVALAWNDFADNLRERNGDPFVPYWQLDENGRFARDMSFRDDKVFQRKLRWTTVRQDITNRSRVLQLLTEFYRVRIRRQPTAWPATEEAVDRRRDDIPEVYAPPTTAPQRLSVDVFAAGMGAWAEMTKQDGREFMVTSVPLHYAMRQDLWERYVASFGDRGERLVPDYIDRFGSALADEAGFTYLPVIAEMRDRAYADDLDLYFQPFSGINWAHMNATGHRLMGEALAGRFCEYWRAGSSPSGASG